VTIGVEQKETFAAKSKKTRRVRTNLTRKDYAGGGGGLPTRGHAKSRPWTSLQRKRGDGEYTGRFSIQSNKLEVRREGGGGRYTKSPHPTKKISGKGSTRIIYLTVEVWGGWLFLELRGICSGEEKEK